MDVQNGETSKKQRVTSGALLAVFAATLEAATFGMVFGYVSPAIPDIKGQPLMATALRLETDEDISWVVSMYGLGSLVGAALAGSLIDRLGRKLVIVSNSVPFVLGWLMIAAANSVPLFSAGRFLTGMCAGVIDVTVPVYLTEVSPASIRGFIASCYELFVNLGILFVFAGGCFLHYRWLAIACSVVCTIDMIMMCFMPETPRWLMASGLCEGAMQSLQFLRGVDNEAQIDKELEEIAETIKASPEKVTWRDILHPTVYKPLGIVVTLLFVQQFSGTNIIGQYTTTIFSSVGVTNLSPYIQTAIVGVVGVTSTAVMATLVDRFGRRPMLLLSTFIMTCSMGGLGAFFLVREKIGDPEVMNNIAWLPIFSLVCFNLGMNIGICPIPYYLGSELFPLKTRGIMCGMCIFINCTFVFLTSYFYTDLVAAIHEYGAYWTFAGVSAIAIVFVLLCVPETKGKTLEAIERDCRK